ncbi:acyl-CoA dehydrogenase family protein [Streptomyces sp. NPDC005303]|uniref:acyl-CoA dehydrogenase family protein n=1 Tax=Streptomyces sp. NPDC005303 TaxID=3155713 RepID=UPI0033A46E8B
MAEQIGVAGPAVPEAYGGAGYGAQEVHVVMEELGRVLSRVPYLGSAVLTTQALLASGDEETCQRLLPPLGTGQLLGPWPGPSGEPGTPTRSRLRLSPSPAGPGASREPRSTSWTVRMPNSCW